MNRKEVERIAKIQNDKYYTPIWLANHCWDKVCEIIGIDNISEIIEPSVGDGAFLHHNTLIPHFAYDIQPECHSSFTNIFKQDYINTNIVYLPGRLVIGNPPYGRCLSQGKKFFEKSTEIADYIAFILPISQLNNARFLYQFDLLYSEDLGEQIYSDIKLHCCFNIYKRPDSGELNQKPNDKLDDISIYRQDCKQYDDIKHDIRMCYWGDGTAGKILNENEHYSGEYKIVINNQALRAKIIDVLINFDWKKYTAGIAMCRIKQYHIVDVLKKYIPEIK